MFAAKRALLISVQALLLSFDKLAEKYTTDDISVGSSGQQKETTKRSSANYEEINEWVFSDERKPGDVKMFVLDENGIYITFYEETGRAAWLAGVDSSMRADDLEKKVNELQETYPATVNDKAIEKVQ